VPSVTLSDFFDISVEKKTSYMLLNALFQLKSAQTCFGHSYAHHQELETILVLLPHMVCDALVAGVRLLGVEQQAMRPG